MKTFGQTFKIAVSICPEYKPLPMEPFNWAARWFPGHSAGQPENLESSDVSETQWSSVESIVGVWTPSMARPETEYYVSQLRLALSQDGKIGEYVIPLRWLRRTIASLEGRSTDGETWEGQELLEQSFTTRRRADLDIRDLA